MKIWDKIVQSDTEPNTGNIWLKEGKLWYYNNGTWTPVSGTDPNLDTTIFSVVENLPDNPSSSKIYITPSTKTEFDNRFTEWCYVDGTWEKLGEFGADIDIIFTKDTMTGKPIINAQYIPPIEFIEDYNAINRSPIYQSSNYTDSIMYSYHVYNGSRNLESRSMNLVTEGALFNQLSAIKDLSTGILRAPILPIVTTEIIDNQNIGYPYPMLAMLSEDNSQLKLSLIANAGTALVGSSYALMTEKGLNYVFNTAKSSIYTDKCTNVNDLISINVPNDYKLTFNFAAYVGGNDRDLYNDSYSFVTEKGLFYAVSQLQNMILSLRSEILDDATDKLQPSVIPTPTSSFVSSGVSANVGGIAIASNSSGGVHLIYRYYNGNRDISENNVNVVTEMGLYKELQAIKSTYTIAPIQIITSGGATDKTNGYIDYDWLSRSANTFGGIPVLTKNSDENPIIRTSQVPITAGRGVTVTRDDESIEVSVDYDSSNVAYIAHLDIGDSSAVKAINQSQIPLSSDPFLVCIDYGVGTGRFIAGTGGSITITTADGARVHYKINSDYSIVKDESHFDHSELFYNLGVINLSEISTTENKTIVISDPIEVLYFKKASNLAFTIHTDNGDFEVNCPQVSVGPTQKIFNSPDIIAGNDEWNYLKTTATIGASEVSVAIEAM